VEASIVLLRRFASGLPARNLRKESGGLSLRGRRPRAAPGRAARQEGALTVYTSLATSESVPLTQAFERNTASKVELWRSLSDQS